MNAERGRYPEIFFHVGLGKTGTTYLQYHFFPRLRGVRYVQRTRYKQHRSIVEKSREKKLFFSREFDRQLEREVSKFAAEHPDTHSLIILRSPESWAASQYRRAVKNGFSGSFRDLIDVENDQGHWSREELLFSKKIEALDRHFSHPPLVLLYEDLKADPYGFFDAIADWLGADYDRSRIDLSPSHSSYRERQLKVMRAASRRLGLKPNPRRSSYKGIKWTQEWGRRLLSYSILYGSYVLPGPMVPKGPLISEGELKRVRDFASRDMEVCYERVRKLSRDL